MREQHDRHGRRRWKVQTVHNLPELSCCHEQLLESAKRRTRTPGSSKTTHVVLSDKYAEAVLEGRDAWQLDCGGSPAVLVGAVEGLTRFLDGERRPQGTGPTSEVLFVQRARNSRWGHSDPLDGRPFFAMISMNFAINELIATDRSRAFP